MGCGYTLSHRPDCEQNLGQRSSETRMELRAMNPRYLRYWASWLHQEGTLRNWPAPGSSEQIYSQGVCMMTSHEVANVPEYIKQLVPTHLENPSSLKQTLQLLCHKTLFKTAEVWQLVTEWNVTELHTLHFGFDLFIYLGCGSFYRNSEYRDPKMNGNLPIWMIKQRLLKF